MSDEKRSDDDRHRDDGKQDKRDTPNPHERKTSPRFPTQRNATRPSEVNHAPIDNSKESRFASPPPPSPFNRNTATASFPTRGSAPQATPQKRQALAAHRRSSAGYGAVSTRYNPCEFRLRSNASRGLRALSRVGDPALTPANRCNRKTVSIAQAAVVPAFAPQSRFSCTLYLRMLSYRRSPSSSRPWLHASWNALLHGNRDRFLSMTWMSIAIAAVGTVIVLFTPLPAAAAWPCVWSHRGSVHLGYNARPRARRTARSDLAQAYPVARGSSPLLVHARKKKKKKKKSAALFAHEAIGPLHALGDTR